MRKLSDMKSVQMENSSSTEKKTKVFVLDNYDSFTYNLVHYLEELNAEVTVKRNDRFELNELNEFGKIILSPGPGLPVDAGLMNDVIRNFHHTHSILGICLGHQAIGEFFGAKLINPEKVYHGIASELKITQRDNYIFNGIPQLFSAGRYHSWCISGENLPEDLKVSAEDENGMIMAVSHKKYDIHGLQFHPESILTECGMEILKNWITN